MKPCLVCGAHSPVDAHHCSMCGCADFGPALSAPALAPDNKPAESPAVEPAPTAPDNKPAARRR